MSKNIFFTIFLLGNLTSFSQPYADYIGGGHSAGITVTSSSSFGTSTNLKTINGSGLDGKFFDASRFMAQATLGADSSMIATAKNMGYEAWINDQFTKPATYILPEMNNIWNTIVAMRTANGQDEEDIFGPYYIHFNYAWWQVNMTNQLPNKNNDLLRQRVAEALSEILVISANSNLGDWGDALSSYYDILLQHSFGNYKDLLKAVSKSVPMGYYLSHLNNPKTDLAENIRPDENYAREIMQLFSIGLFKLNPDGTEQLDGNGFPIPTYDNDDIKEMAKIFTGLHGGALYPCPDPPLPQGCTCYNPNDNCNSSQETCCWWPTSPQFGLDPYFLVKTAPMIMSNSNHEPGPKVMPDGSIINIPNNGMAEVDAAIDWLMNHQNIGPFISYRLIQRLVKSNPSPAYVQRVAAKFNNNGSGVKGDLKEVIKAILLDEEARNTEYLTDQTNGMLLNPTLRYTQFCKGNTLDSDLGRFWNHGYSYLNEVLHMPMASPTVFNFYSPFYAPNGPIKNEGLVAPEFKIMNSNSAINYLNHVNTWTAPWANNEGEMGYVMWSWESIWDPNTNTSIELDSTIHLSTVKFEPYADDKEKLIHEMDKLYTHGAMSENTKNILRGLHNLIMSYSWYPLDIRKKFITRNFLYFIFISPEYNILK